MQAIAPLGLKTPCEVWINRQADPQTVKLKETLRVTQAVDLWTIDLIILPVDL